MTAETPKKEKKVTKYDIGNDKKNHKKSDERGQKNDGKVMDNGKKVTKDDKK